MPARSRFLPCRSRPLLPLPRPLLALPHLPHQRVRHVPILVGGESKPAMRRVARAGDGWLPYNLPVADAPRVIGELKDMTRAEGRDPDRLRIVKIVYSNATIDDLKRYRDAGVTEFNIASSGEIPTDAAGIEAKFVEFGERLVDPIAQL